MKRSEKREKAHEKRRPGFSMLEVILASLLMATALISSFGIIFSSLSITTEVRARMDDYSQLEHAGLLSVASGDIVPPVAGTGIVYYSAPCVVPITIGSDTKTAGFTNVVYSYEQGAGKTSKMKSPVFVVFVPETPTP
jgi:hypothetical protein